MASELTFWLHKVYKDKLQCELKQVCSGMRTINDFKQVENLIVERYLVRVKDVPQTPPTLTPLCQLGFFQPRQYHHPLLPAVPLTSPQTQRTPPPLTPILTENTTTPAVYCILCTGKVVGACCISPRVLKTCPSRFCRVLLFLFYLTPQKVP